MTTLKGRWKQEPMRRLLSSPKKSWWWFRTGGGSGDEGERRDLRCSSQVKFIELIDGLDGEKEIYYICLFLCTFKWGLTMSHGLDWNSLCRSDWPLTEAIFLPLYHTPSSDSSFSFKIKSESHVHCFIKINKTNRNPISNLILHNYCPTCGRHCLSLTHLVSILWTSAMSWVLY